jgi:hypothetical protein
VDTTVTLHMQVSPLAALLGTWSGEGHGRYPTIDDFDYGEEIVFNHVGKPFLAYRQRTWDLADGRPLHAEVGYWRVVPGETPPWSIEVVLAHPSGVAEVSTGLVSGAGDHLQIDVASASVVTTPTAKEVTSLARRITVAGHDMRYVLDMAAVGQAAHEHLTAQLIRV